MNTHSQKNNICFIYCAIYTVDITMYVFCASNLEGGHPVFLYQTLTLFLVDICMQISIGWDNLSQVCLFRGIPARVWLSHMLMVNMLLREAKFSGVGSSSSHFSCTGHGFPFKHRAHEASWQLAIRLHLEQAGGESLSWYYSIDDPLGVSVCRHNLNSVLVYIW